MIPPLRRDVYKRQEIPASILLFAGDGPLTAVAADEPSAIGEGVDGKLAVVSALTAAAALRLSVEAPQLPLCQERTVFSLYSFSHPVQRRSISAHQSRNVGADDLDPHFLLKSPEHGFVIERAARHHHMAAQLLRLSLIHI